MFIGARGEPKTELISLSNVLLEPPLPSLSLVLVRVCRKLNILPFSNLTKYATGPFGNGIPRMQPIIPFLRFPT